MTLEKRQDLLAILIALVLIFVFFGIENVFAESRSSIKTRVRINGETVIDEEETTEGSADSDVSVKIENGEGSVKYKVNGEEKTIQVTPKSNSSGTVLNDTDADEDEKDDNDEKESSGVNETDDEKDEDEKEDGNTKDTKETKDEDTSEAEVKAIRRDLIQQMMEALDNFFAKFSSLFG